jgi:hypothetical protein
VTLAEWHRRRADRNGEQSFRGSSPRTRTRSDQNGKTQFTETNHPRGADHALARSAAGGTPLDVTISR